MNEVQAAFGLLQLQYVDAGIAKRKQISEIYRNELKEVNGITCLYDLPNLKHAYSYFPILIDKQEYGMSRDELYEKLKANNIFGRRYFYPLISNFPTYSGLPSAHLNNLPVANKVANKVLCLPIYADLDKTQQQLIINTITQ